MGKIAERKTFKTWVFGQQGKEVKDSRLESLPVEISLEIFKNLDPAASLFLALSCPYLYSIHKTAHIYIPPLWMDVGSWTGIQDPTTHKLSHNPPIPLGRLLQAWMGKKYQPSISMSRPSLSAPYLPFFHRKSINPYSKHHDQMITRYRDYHLAFRDGQYRLPDPRNKKTKVWNEEAKAAILADAVNFSSFSRWADFWYGHTTLESGAQIRRLGRWERLVIWEDFYDRELREKNPGKNRTSSERKWCRYGIYWGILTMPVRERHLVTLGMSTK